MNGGYMDIGGMFLDAVCGGAVFTVIVCFLAVVVLMISHGAREARRRFQQFRDRDLF